MRRTIAVAAGSGLGLALLVALGRSLGLAAAAELALIAVATAGAAVLAARLHAGWSGANRAAVSLEALLSRSTRGRRSAADMGVLVDELAAELDAERRESAQREEILEAVVVKGAPMAILLLSEAGRVVYANAAASELLFEGAPLVGENFLLLLNKAPAAFREAFLAESDELFTVEEAGELETYHLSKRHFERDRQSSTLVVLKHLTREIRRQEVDVWKRLIRTLSHELNNSLAPITSLVHSARRIAQNPEQLPKLDKVFSTIEERAAHLTQFLEGYARVARLPKPRPGRVDWADFLGKMRLIAPWASIADAPPRPGWFDASQLEQVVLNLLKNAEEAGGGREGVELHVSPVDGGVELAVSDRGSGMTSETLSKALLPFYSTKERGSGLGLPLCREIIEAHGGKLRLQNRAGGGLTVTCFLPDRDFTAPPSRARLTLTKA